MRYYLIAGEASGDLHGANLMKGLKKHDPEAEFRFWGGDRMAEIGGAENLVTHYKEASFMGFVEVLVNICTINRQMRECKADVARYSPDVLILIDYPGFNFKMAEFAHKRGIRTFYYISPKVWAWKEKRVKLIQKYVDQLFIIFPFEIEYFKQRGVDAIFEGNPLADAVEQERQNMPSREEFLQKNRFTDEERPVVALLAGSRKTEIASNLPFMVRLAGKYPQYKFIVGGVSWLDKEIYEKHIGGSDVGYVRDQTYQLLSNAQAAIVTSGTATLETALIGTPEMVCYRTGGLGGQISMSIAQSLVSLEFVSLVNLIMGREVVRELIQREMKIKDAQEEFEAIMPGGKKREQMLADFEELRNIIGAGGVSERFAGRMVEILKNERK